MVNTDTNDFNSTQLIVVIQDACTGLYFNCESISSHGCWLPVPTFAPTFETEQAARWYAKAAGMNLASLRFVNINK